MSSYGVHRILRMSLRVRKLLLDYTRKAKKLQDLPLAATDSQPRLGTEIAAHRVGADEDALGRLPVSQLVAAQRGCQSPCVFPSLMV